MDRNGAGAWQRISGQSLRLRIGASFAALSLIILLLGIFAASRAARSGDAAAAIFDRALIATSYARSAADGFSAMEARFYRDRDALTPEGILAMLEEQAELILGDIQIAVQRDGTQGVEAAGSAAGSAAIAWAERARAAAATAVLAPLSAEAREQFDRLVNHVAGEAFRRRQAARAAVEDAWLMTAGATGLALLLAAGLALLLARRIIHPVAAASSAARGIAAGQLDTPIPAGGRDELGALLVAMARMRDAIRATIEDEQAERRSAQNRLSDALQVASEGVVLTDAAGRITIANARAAALLPEAGALIRVGEDWHRAAADAAAGFAEAPEVVARALRAPPPQVAEIGRHDGGWLRIARSPAQAGGAVAILSDVTELKQREAAIAETNRRFGVALDSMAQGLVLFDAAERLLVANRQAAELLRLPEAATLPGTPWAAFIDDTVAAAEFSVPEAAAHRHDALRFVARRAGGDRIWRLPDARHLAISIAPTPDGGFVTTWQDVTERETAQGRITHLARHDQLTGLPNRVLARERIAGLVADGVAFAVHSIDLFRFREVNDCHGVLAADRVLAEVAARLRGEIRAEDLAARLSGDDFVVVQPCADGRDAAAMASRIAEVLAPPCDIDGEAVAIRISQGFAMAPEDGGSVDILLRHADLAGERAAIEGGGQPVRFHPDMDQALRARRSLENDLRRALAEDALELHYQPLVDTRSGRVTGLEALLRWTHPTRGRVSPAEFVPLAERSGLIVPIGEWVIRRAARDALRWAGDIRVAVNVSPLQFRSSRLPDTVLAALEESGLAPGRLEIEITESTLIEDADLVLAVLRRLRAAGLRTAIDDFGTGYSSLATLRAFPFDKIKIDQSFVRVPDADIPQADAIVRAVAGLAAALGMRCTAEGVETVEQLARLRAAGCTEVQGYLLARPVPAAEVAAAIRGIESQSLVADAA